MVEILKKYWGYDAFRPLQEDIIQSVLAGQDTLALMPTGGGKSICFQVPALVQEGLCVVVSPLIALMKDQVEQLHKRGIGAVALHSGMSKHEIDIALDNCIYGQVKFLYCSPERLQTDIFVARVKQMNVNLLAIDEAHCVSAWGYDFRPPYLLIAEFRTLLPRVPVLALTATATPEVTTDIVDKLGMVKPHIFQKSFARPNLSYSAFLEENKEGRLLGILQKIPNGSAVVYVRSRKRTQELAQWLQRNGLSATFYHAGLPAKERSQRQEEWIQNKVRIMVSTNAFGMGIDKPDVRVVVHLDLPETLEAYYQEAGRAGRDEKKAFAVALFDKTDIEDLAIQVQQSYPKPEVIRKVYQCLANYYQLAVGSGEMASFDFDMADFIRIYQLGAIETHFSLKILQTEGLLQLNEAFFVPSRLLFLVNHQDLYAFQVANARYDKFTKTLLRMYGGGLYTMHHKIDEGEIAKHFLSPVAEVTQMLRYLHQLQIADYQPRKDKPQLTFLVPRQEATNLRLNLANIESRHQRDTSKAKAVAHYMQHDRRCRTQLLLEYFGEQTTATCGVCDNCLAEKKRFQSNNLAHSQREQVLALLQQNGKMPLQVLLTKIAPPKESDLLEVIREMLGNEEIKYDEVGYLESND